MKSLHARLNARTLAIATSLAAVLSLGSCSSSDDSSTQAPPGGNPDPDSLIDRARDLGFGQFVALMEASSFRSALEGEAAAGDLTVFAPSDASFALLPAGEIQALFEPASLSELDAFVGYHLAPGALDLATLGSLNQLSMLSGGEAFVDSAGDSVVINDARIESLDEGADNGLLYGLSRPLEAPRSVLETLERRGFTRLLELLELSTLDGIVNGGQLTLLAPTDAAFDALPQADLDDLYDPALQAERQDRLELHLTAGVAPITERISQLHAQNLEDTYLFFATDGDGRPAVNGTRLDSVNVRCTDGVIHVLPEVFDRLPTVGDQVSAQGLLTLGSLVFASGQAADLNDASPLALFGPTDLALELGLAPGVIDSLVDPANVSRLQQFLRAHQVAAPASYESLVPGTTLDALSGDLISVTESLGETTLNGSVRLSSRNVYASNGVLHVIDGVLDNGE